MTIKSKHTMAARPMTERERADAEKAAKLLVSVAENYADYTTVFHHTTSDKNRRKRDVAWQAYQNQSVAYGEQIARALLSTSAAVRGMRDALEKADHALTYAVIRMADDFLIEKLKATQKTVHAALSGIEPGEDEQARSVVKEQKPDAIT